MFQSAVGGRDELYLFSRATQISVPIIMVFRLGSPLRSRTFGTVDAFFFYSFLFAPLVRGRPSALVRATSIRDIASDASRLQADLEVF